EDNNSQLLMNKVVLTSFKILKTVEGKVKGGSFIRFALHLYSGVMFLEDVLYGTEAYPNAFRLLGVEGIKEFSQLLLVQATAIVGDLEGKIVLPPVDAQLQDPLVRFHGFTGVDDQVQQGDLQLFLIGIDVVGAFVVLFDADP